MTFSGVGQVDGFLLLSFLELLAYSNQNTKDWKAKEACF